MNLVLKIIFFFKSLVCDHTYVLKKENHNVKIYQCDECTKVLGFINESTLKNEVDKLKGNL